MHDQFPAGLDVEVKTNLVIFLTLIFERGSSFSPVRGRVVVWLAGLLAVSVLAFETCLLSRQEFWSMDLPSFRGTADPWIADLYYRFSWSNPQSADTDSSLGPLAFVEALVRVIHRLGNKIQRNRIGGSCCLILRDGLKPLLSDPSVLDMLGLNLSAESRH